MPTVFSALKFLLANGAMVLDGTVDPTAGAGVVAPLGSLYLCTAVQQAWLKTSVPNTGWTIVALGGGGTSPEFGSGSDGNLHFDGMATVLGIVPSGNVYTLLRDIFAVNCLVDTGAKIFANGYRIFVAGTLTLTGTANINGDGRSATTQFTPNSYNDEFYAHNGDSGSGAGNPAPNFTTTNIPNWGNTAPTPANTNAIGFGAGGGGGNGFGNPGGTGGSIGAPVNTPGGYTQSAARNGRPDNFAAFQYNYGSGGGGGGWDLAANFGGAGGTGGWIAYVAAKIIAGTGTITAKGGNGAHGEIQVPGGGGGGGGGGGVVVVVFMTATGTVTTSVAAGAGGAAGSGAGSRPGGRGSDGTVFQYNLSGDGTHV